ncbi:MAG: chemotaxis response regulator protein-glutamate methylesterase [Actinobacteria bacterium 13_1_20CM_3_71_11]|nr:MAG: chemotaxis response regulator protein-glutamate methylesterase [Actinobacteria bacterium 13_1_20CM_3_71_11]TML31872.1 MAG: chemotaxis-specific protein-glutamate methyltransferase CheB [Actinomycetota bacterium]
MISVLVVDDSVVVRRLIAAAVEAEPGIRVAGTAANGRIALNKIEQLAPDVITLDIEMPELDGLGTLRELRRTNRTLPVIMFSTLSVAGAAATLEALAAGATDFVTKPAHAGSFAESQRMVREQLIPKIHSLGGGRLRPTPARVPAPAPRRTGRLAALTIASSTGGPDALTKVLGRLPATLAVPVLVVQHMPPVFTKMFAERLDRACAIKVVEAVDGMPVTPGVAYLAPGDYHLTVVGRPGAATTRLTQEPAENSCRPAADVLFRSVAQVYGGASLAVVLTGMGQDGRHGAERLRQAGAEVVAQDQASSVVWGMPGAVVAAGLADAVLPLAEIGGYLALRATTAAPAQTRAVAS